MTAEQIAARVAQLRNAVLQLEKMASEPLRQPTDNLLSALREARRDLYDYETMLLEEWEAGG